MLGVKIRPLAVGGLAVIIEGSKIPLEVYPPAIDPLRITVIAAF